MLILFPLWSLSWRKNCRNPFRHSKAVLILSALVDGVVTGALAYILLVKVSWLWGKNNKKTRSFQTGSWWDVLTKKIF